MKTNYFISRDPAGDVSHLVRIRETDHALWGEYFQDGLWIEAASVMSYLTGDVSCESISEIQALEITKFLQYAGDQSAASTR